MESGEVARAGRLCADQMAGAGTAGKCTGLLYVCTALLASVWAGTQQRLGPAAIFGPARPPDCRGVGYEGFVEFMRMGLVFLMLMREVQGT
jgi:hypothetical protein